MLYIKRVIRVKENTPDRVQWLHVWFLKSAWILNQQAHESLWPYSELKKIRKRERKIIMEDNGI